MVTARREATSHGISGYGVVSAIDGCPVLKTPASLKAATQA
jgi:hypothetical protein